MFFHLNFKRKSTLCTNLVKRQSNALGHKIAEAGECSGSLRGEGCASGQATNTSASSLPPGSFCAVGAIQPTGSWTLGGFLFTQCRKVLLKWRKLFPNLCVWKFPVGIVWSNSVMRHETIMWQRTQKIRTLKSGGPLVVQGMFTKCFYLMLGDQFCLAKPSSGAGWVMWHLHACSVQGLQASSRGRSKPLFLHAPPVTDGKERLRKTWGALT